VKELESIRKLYNPIQPSDRIENENIQYREFYPSESIQNYVYCYWELNSKKTLSKPYSYRVVSDGCIDIFFDRENSDQNFVMGFCRKYAEFKIGTSFKYYGIRFLPSIFPLIFKVNAKEISNNSSELKKVLPEFAQWLSNLNNENSRSLPNVLNSKIHSIIENQELKLDLRFLNSLTEILKRNGFIDLEKELATGVSPRQLRRIFNYYIGTTPKAFANVVRFQYILNGKPSMQSLKENKIYYDVGFFDQAHFIKSFKTFYGVTPSEAFR